MTKLLPFKQLLSWFWLPSFKQIAPLRPLSGVTDQSCRYKTPTQWRQKTVSTSTELLMTHGGGVGWREGSPQALSAYKQHIQKQKMVTNVEDPRQVMRIHLHPLTFVILARSLGLGNWVPKKNTSRHGFHACEYVGMTVLFYTTITFPSDRAPLH